MARRLVLVPLITRTGGKTCPEAAFAARETRALPGRVIGYLAAGAGIRQFPDNGTGIPAAGNTHQAAQAIAPNRGGVCVDYDPAVLAHARAPLIGVPVGVTAYIDAGAGDTGLILDQAARTPDLTRPVAVMLLGIVQPLQPSAAGRPARTRGLPRCPRV